MGRNLVKGRWAWGVVLVLVVASTPRTAASAPPSAKKVEPAPRSVLFPNVEVVRYDEFIAEVRRVADELATTPEVEQGYRALLADYALAESDMSIQSFSRVRLAFEATRDGGLWGVRWTVTDRMPWSDAIWKQWRDEVPQGDPDVTAEAECDELSALFAFLARDLQIEGFVGLFWPTWNHTVAVWQLTRGGTTGSPKAVRVLVPTSQIWLSREASLGTREFKTDRVIFPYQRRDLKPQSEIPAPVARFLIERLVRFGSLSTAELLERRNRLGGS